MYFALTSVVYKRGAFHSKIFGEIRKTHKRRRIIVQHTMRALHTSTQISAGQNVKFIGHPSYCPNDFCLFPHIKKKIVINDFRSQKMLLKRSKIMFWRCLNRSGKTNINDGRTSKYSEYCYAKKCQTFLGKCQISAGNTRNMLGQKFK